MVGQTILTSQPRFSAYPSPLPRRSDAHHLRVSFTSGERDSELTKDDVHRLVYRRRTSRRRFSLRSLSLSTHPALPDTHHRAPGIPVAIDEGEPGRLDRVVTPVIDLGHIWPLRNREMFARRICLLADLGCIVQRQPKISPRIRVATERQTASIVYSDLRAAQA